MDLPTLTRALSEAKDDVDRIVIVSVTKEVPRSQSHQETVNILLSVIGKEHIEDIEVLFDNTFVLVTLHKGHEYAVDLISLFYHRHWVYTFYHPHPIPGKVEGILRGFPRFYSMKNMDALLAPLKEARFGFSDFTTEYIPLEGTDFLSNDIKVTALIQDLTLPRGNFGLLFHTIRAGPFRGDVRFKVVAALHKVDQSLTFPAEKGFEVEISRWRPN